ncbi:hypothetical protein COS81_00615 [candidate division WWE3 bacterium CG06_land_8_20_14_3_00_42_16]|uniref:DUF2330 domain-containing protein n=3 Tax=Katanobacteria TaxID=422282 RepID=A0A2M7APN2_UNCKA|nr:MAG: hypothetical protein AUJ38_02255 [bacterium CG1_02_42_9]PIU69270.1 MAG: hypothetical protein COS81_00615 [candidate division WWE3 bacterium CG06_land_8_20_14_3_00_42_16]PJA37588.1 MAG: hypothetical protein CO181_02900 [candidate division WWE3 bacterium CG_4_9_14_3_um_filter_43_9]PJC68722.1 MAG: hypothetical protein CO015_03035 [candidate division WWE3 bacterium CG_4_8_14_3_um_filter_42_11]
MPKKKERKMKKCWCGGILVFVFFLTGIPLFSKVSADGMIIPSPDYPVYEAEQKAAIFYDAGTQTENLVLSVKFNGQAKDFGWLIPTPSKPEVEKVASDFFDKLASASKPQKNLLEKLKGSSDEGIDLFGIKTSNIGLGSSETTTVEVWEEKRVGILDIAVLSAVQPDDLFEWIDKNGYQIPGVGESGSILYEDYERYQQEASSSGSVDNINNTSSEAQLNALRLLQEYIDDGWFFVAVKVNGLFAGSTDSYDNNYEYTYNYSQGQINPLRLQFKVTKPIYPLKLSSLAKQNINILLYVITGERMDVWGGSANLSEQRSSPNITSILPDTNYSSALFQTQYAGLVSQDAMDSVVSGINQESWFTPKDPIFLTKLYASYLSYAQMDNDLMLEKAAKNKTVNAGKMTLGNWIVLPLYVVVYGPARLVEWFFAKLGSGFSGSSTSILFFIPLICGFLLLLSAAWIAVCFHFLRKTRKTMKRIFLFALQTVGIWILVSVLVTILVIPYLILLALVGSDGGVALLNVILYASFGLVLLTTLIHKLLTALDRKLEQRETAKKAKETPPV